MKVYEAITGAEHIEFDEDRIDIIGSNGNEGTHYGETGMTRDLNIEKVIRESLGIHFTEGVRGKSLNDLQVDSLDRVEMVMALEEAFEIEVEDSMAESWVTFEDVEKGVKQCLMK